MRQRYDPVRLYRFALREGDERLAELIRAHLRRGPTATRCLEMRPEPIKAPDRQRQLLEQIYRSLDI